MPQLPSGRSVDIMAERARYHARRLGLRISAHTPHQQLYPLVDILIDPGNGHGCRGCIGFSGHTLADRAWLNGWEEGDRRFFLNWLREESQVRVIEQARTRLLAERSATYEQLHDYPARLYSVLRRRIEALPMRRARAAQWRNTLLNMRRDGLRAEELEWSHLPEYLSSHDDDEPVTREALLAALDFTAVTPRLSNELEVEAKPHLPFVEVAQRLPAYQLSMAGYPVDEADVGVVRLRSREPHYRVGVIRPSGRSLQVRHWFVLGPYGKPLADAVNGTLLFPSMAAAMAAADQHARNTHRLRPAVNFSHTYEYMSLHGGEAYREWLVTLPEYQRSHFTAHYHERNVLLHIRTKERESLDGTRVLFIEELQSDWHQALARYGTRRGIPTAPYRREWVALGLKLMVLHAIEQGLEGIAWADAAVHQMRYDRHMRPLQRLYDQELPRALQRLARPWGARLERAAFATRSPWLHAARCNDCWKVEGGAGRFSTRPRYDKAQALELIERHSKAVSLELPLLRLPEAMRRHIAEAGLPLFGLGGAPAP